MAQVTVEFAGEQAQVSSVYEVDERFGADKAFIMVPMIVRYKTGNKTHHQYVAAYLKNGVFVVPAYSNEWRGRSQRVVFVVGFTSDVVATSKW